MSPAAHTTVSVPQLIRTADGALVLGGRAAGGEVSALTLAVPLAAGGDRTTALAAPLLAALWSGSVARAARRSGAAVRVGPVTTADYTGVTVEALRADRRLLDAVPGWFTAADGPDPEFDRARAECLARLGSDDRWSDGVRRDLFGSAHRYGIGHDERAAFLTACGPEQIAPLSARLRAAPPVLALSDPDPGQLRELVAAVADQDRRSGKPGPGPSGGQPPDAPPVPVQRPVSAFLRSGPGLAHHLLGTPGVRLGSPDKAALHLAWAVLGGREGLLDRRLRGERALTYSLAAFSREFASAGYGLVVAACAPRTLEEVAAETYAVLASLAREDVSTGRLASVQEQLVIRYHRAAGSGRGLTERLCGYAIAGLDPRESARYPDRLIEVTPRRLREVAERYLTAASTEETTR